MFCNGIVCASTATLCPTLPYAPTYLLVCCHLFPTTPPDPSCVHSAVCLSTPDCRSSRSRKEDIYRSGGSAYSAKTITSEDCRSEPDSQSEQINGKEKTNTNQNGDPGVNIMVSQKALTPKPQGRHRSPLEGWASEPPSEKEGQETTETKSLHSEKDDVDVQNGDTNNAMKEDSEQKEVDRTAEKVTELSVDEQNDIKTKNANGNGISVDDSDNDKHEFKAESKTIGDVHGQGNNTELGNRDTIDGRVQDAGVTGGNQLETLVDVSNEHNSDT